MQELQQLLETARRPVRHPRRRRLGPRQPRCKLQDWLEAHGLPAGTSFRCQDLLDNRSPSYAGDVGIGINPKLAQRVKEADVLLVIGARLGEMTTSAYTLVEAPLPRQTLIHVHAGAEELGRVYRPALPINSGYPQFVDALAGLQFEQCRLEGADRGGAQGIPRMDRAAADARASVQYGEVIRWLSRQAARGRHHRQRRGQLRRLACTAISATRASARSSARPTARWATAIRRRWRPSSPQPKRTVLALCGDGDFLMTGQEIATAVQYGANFVALVVNNGMYGTIRMHQEREYPGRVFGTELKNPDFAAYARAFGGARRDGGAHRGLRAGVRARRGSGKPALIELKIDPDAITPATTLSAIREKGQLKSKQ